MGWPYVLRRLLQVVPAVAAILVITFGVIHLAPGDPVDAVASGNGDAQYYAFMRHKFGLDKPVVEQFRIYAANVLRGDLGVSFAQGDRVSTLIRKRLGPTLLLMGTALVASSVGGIVFGLVAARRPFGLLDLGFSTFALVAYALPVFWLAQIGLLTLAFRAGWVPIQGMTDARAAYTGVAHILDVAHHLVLPGLVLAVSELALVARVARPGRLASFGGPEPGPPRHARPRPAGGVQRRPHQPPHRPHLCLDRPPHPLPLRSRSPSASRRSAATAGWRCAGSCATPRAWPASC